MADTGIVDANHALLTGQIFGCLMRLEQDGTEIKPIMRGGDYTNLIEIERPSGVYRVRVEAPE